ncbi:MAG: flagellar basal body rod protein FlgB [Planctomycetota bacterium]
MSGVFGEFLAHGAMPAMEATLRFTEARHRLILSNIANVDTPGYRRLDLDVSRFQRDLKTALRDGRDSELTATEFAAGAHRRVSTRQAALTTSYRPRLAYEGPVRHDENSISPEREMAVLAMNAGTYSRMAALLRKAYGQLRAVIGEKPDLAG